MSALPPPLSGDWLALEPGWRELRADLWRLMRRNRSHPGPLLLLLLLATAAGLVRGYRWKPLYEARITLRIIENDIDLETRPRPAEELRSWVYDIALPDEALIRMIERFDLYKAARARGIDQALADMRDDLDVDVWRNEFRSEGPRDPIGRAARIALSYKNGDAEVAFQVVSALAQATIQEQRRMRKAQVEFLDSGLAPALAQAKQQLRERQQALAQALVEAATSRMATVKVTVLRDEVADLTRQIDELSATSEEANLRLQAETLNIGLQAEIIDTDRPVVKPYRVHAMASNAALCGFVALVLGGIVIKAFDRRIYDADDVRRLGLAVWGQLSAERATPP